MYVNGSIYNSRQRKTRPLPGYQVTTEQCGDRHPPALYHNTQPTSLTWLPYLTTYHILLIPVVAELMDPFVPFFLSFSLNLLTILSVYQAWDRERGAQFTRIKLPVNKSIPYILSESLLYHSIVVWGVPCVVLCCVVDSKPTELPW